MESKSLREKKVQLVEELRAMNAVLKSEKRTEFGAEEQVKWDNINKDIDTLSTRINQIERMEELDREEANRKPVEKTPEELTHDEKHLRAFRDYLKNGNTLSAESRNFLKEVAKRQQSTVGTEGGYLIPQGFSNEIEKRLKLYGGMYDVARIFTTASGNDIPWPTIDDTSNVAVQVDELDPVTGGTDAVFGVKTLKAFKWTPKIMGVSSELIEDSAFDILAFLADLASERLWRGLNAAWTTGAGTTTFQGVTVGAAASGVTAAATAITKDNLLDLIHSVDPMYRMSPSARLMFNDKTLSYLRKLENTSGNPLFQTSDIVGVADTIEGVKYVINQSMPNIGASAKSMVYGDFSKYVIRQVSTMRTIVLNELLMANDQKGVLLFARFDGQVMQANALKTLVHAAS